MLIFMHNQLSINSLFLEEILIALLYGAIEMNKIEYWLKMSVNLYILPLYIFLSKSREQPIFAVQKFPIRLKLLWPAGKHKKWKFKFLFHRPIISIIPLTLLNAGVFITIAHGISSTSSGFWVQDGGQSLSFPTQKRVPTVKLPWLGGLLPGRSSGIILWMVALLEKIVNL